MENIMEIIVEGERYGAELAENIEDDVEYSSRRESDWKLEVIYESDFSITFAFVTGSFSCIYEVSKGRKVINDKYILGRVECEKLHLLMEGLDQAE